MIVRNTNRIATVGAMFCLGAILLSASMGACRAEDAVGTLAPQHAFRMERIEILSLIPFSPTGVMAIPKDGYTFVVVLLGPVTPKTRIQPKHLGVTVFYQYKTYQPMAFGFPLKDSLSPLVLVGRLASGHIRIIGPKKSFVGLIYELPKDVKSIQVQTGLATSTTMQLDAQYRVPDSSRISDLFSEGLLQQDKYRTAEEPAADI